MSQNRVHYSEVNSQIAVEFNPGELKARDVFLPMEVTAETDVYPVFQKDAFVAIDDSRSDGAPSKPSSIGWKYVPYTLHEHALHDFITNRQRRNAKSQIDLEAIKTRTLKRRVLNNMEKAAFGSTGILRQTANNGGNANYDLSTLSTASPRTMFRTAINTVELNCGKSPNTVVMGKDVARHIMATTEYREEFKYVLDIRGEGNAELPPTMYGMNAVYVDALVSSVNKGQAITPARLMGEDVWVGYIDPSGSAFETVTYGLCLYTEEYAEMWWDQDARADKLEYGIIYNLQLVAKECGYLCTSVLTA